MNNYLVIYSDEAVQDLRDIFEYIAFDLMEQITAVAQVKRIREEIRALHIFPRQNKSVEWEPWSSMGMRLMPVDHFIVFYLVDDETNSVQIVRIVYGKRDMPKLADRP